MRILTTTLMAFGLLAAPATGMADPAAAGKKHYDMLCTACHGPAGAGDGAAAAALNPKPRNFQDAAFWKGVTDDHLKKVIGKGGMAVGKSPLMAGFAGSLTPAQIDEVIAFLKTLKK
jgi:mono/diheme cytochrome c family protein